MSFDARRYSELLAQTRPAVIETAEEHDRMLDIAEQLMDKGDSLSAEEQKLLELFVLLIEAFEAEVETAGEEDEEDDEEHEIAAPHETIARLLSARGLDLGDISDIFGSPHAAREALEGKRPISRGQATQLARFFRVPAKLFTP